MYRLFSPCRYVTGFVPQSFASFVFRRVLLWIEENHERIVRKLICFSLVIVLTQVTKSEWRKYKLPDEHLEVLRHEGWQMYGAVAEFYRVLLVPPVRSSHHEGWSLELAESTRKRVPQAKVLYPRELPACR